MWGEEVRFIIHNEEERKDPKITEIENVLSIIRDNTKHTNHIINDVIGDLRMRDL